MAARKKSPDEIIEKTLLAVLDWTLLDWPLVCERSHCLQVPISVPHSSGTATRFTRGERHIHGLSDVIYSQNEYDGGCCFHNEAIPDQLDVETSTAQKTKHTTAVQARWLIWHNVRALKHVLAA